MKARTRQIFDRLTERRPELAPCKESIEQAYDLVLESQQENGRLLVCGNGGSAADSVHIVGELLKSFDHPRHLADPLRARLKAVHPELGAHLANHLQQPIRALSLVSEAALITAVANDTDADLIFAQQALGQGQAGDVLLAISTSGNSKNILYAAVAARAIGVKVIALTGPKESKLKEIADCTINAPGESTPEIQESHLPIYHALCLMLESELFD